MNISVKNADFSTLNLGRLDTRTAPNSTTQAILDYYGKTWNLTQKLAIEDFLTTFNNSTVSTSVTNLLVPIFSQQETILNASSPKSFYDLITGTIIAPLFRTYSEDKIINENGLSDPNPTELGSNNTISFLPLEPVSWDDVHIGSYWKKSGTDTDEVIMASRDFIDLFLMSDRAKFGNANKVDYIFDPNSISTRGLRLVSWNGTDANGIAAGLPLVSATISAGAASSGVDSSGAPEIILLSRYNAVDDVTIGLISFGTALSQSQITEYDIMIETLMNALWVD